MTDQPSMRQDVQQAGFELVFSDQFDGPALDESRWVDHYLPHWTTPDRSAARYDFDSRGLRLRIDADQPPWRDEDGTFRVSNIQTGTFAGPVGSSVGTHHHASGMTVRTALAPRRLYLPSEGLVEATLQGSGDSACMLAIWLVGFEENSPNDAGEICIAELFGDAISPERSRVRLGVKAINDPRLHTDVVDIELPIDATKAHTYGASWNSERVHFYIDGRLVRTVEQGIDYPLQLMIDLFEFPGDGPRDADAYPKSAHVRSVRGYRSVRSDE